MRDAMMSRGPDGAGVWISDDGHIGLGHRRLAILDLSDMAKQPMCDHEGSLWISFNGEIYNHSDIRRQLDRTCCPQWKTQHSDTEVILYAFKHWGIECVNHFIGMFAFSIWDTKKQELWLVRDRIGIKPLYYSIHDGRFTFASEIKALLKDPQQKRAVNEESLFHYLSFLVTPAPHTMFEGIEKLPGGTWLKVTSDGHITKTRYWDAFDNKIDLGHHSEADISERIREELRKAVAWRKVSDVPVGVFLSGGIDSSINAALFSEGEKEQVRTFCIGYQGNYSSCTDETYYARFMADTIGAKYHEHLLTYSEFIEFIPRMIQLQDEPLADPVCFPTYYVSKLARDNGVTVCQVGEGADELFCGYIFWKNMLFLQKMNDYPYTGLLKNGMANLMQLFDKKDTFHYETLRRGIQHVPIFWGGAEGFTHTQKMKLLSPRLRDKFSRMTSWEAIKPIYNRFMQKTLDGSPLNWMSYLDLNLRLPELLLMRVDKMSMGVGLEARVPFLDHNIVELALSIPEKMKIRNGNLKHILKTSVHGLIPDKIINRKKQGFTIPFTEWLNEGLKDRIRNDMLSFCKNTDYLDITVVNEYLEKPKFRELWYLENLALWWNEFIR